MTTNSNDALVHLTVGRYSYTTRKSVLLSSPEDSYFHAILSDKWQSDTNDMGELTLNLPDRDGRMFFYVLYFLEHGNIPRPTGSNEFNSYLSDADTTQLKSEADYFGLNCLEELCKTTEILLKDFGCAGDFDLSAFSNFWYHVVEEDRYSDYSLSYVYDKRVGVDVEFSTDYRSEPRLRITSMDTRKILLDEKSFKQVYSSLEAIIESMKPKSKDEPAHKSTDLSDQISVSKVLNQIPDAVIPNETRLWWAMQVKMMIDCSLGNYEGNSFHFQGHCKDAGF